MMVSLLWLAKMFHIDSYTSTNGSFWQYSTVFRTFTADQRYRRKSRLSFTLFSTIVHKREILDKCVYFSTVSNNSLLSLTLSSTIAYISHILYAVFDYCLHFSIYFCPVWLAIYPLFNSFSWETQLRINSSLDDCDCNLWIWRENQRGALIGFSYSEIRFLDKNIVKCLNLNAIFRESIYFFQFFFVLQHYIEHKFTFLWAVYAKFNKMHQREHKA